MFNRIAVKLKEDGKVSKEQMNEILEEEKVFDGDNKKDGE